MLLEGRCLRVRIAVHVAAILRPLRPAVVRILKLTLVPSGFVSSRVLGPTRLVRRRGLPTGVIGVL